LILLRSTSPLSPRAIRKLKERLKRKTAYVDWLPVRVTYTVPVVPPKTFGDGFVWIVS